MNEGQLYIDGAQDGHRAFHATLHVVTIQGCKPLPVMVDARADVNTIPLNRYRALFPNHFTPNGSLKPTTLRGAYCTWSLHDGETQLFLGYFTSEIQQNTQPDIIPITCYVFKDSQDPTPYSPTPCQSTSA